MIKKLQNTFSITSIFILILFFINFFKLEKSNSINRIKIKTDSSFLGKKLIENLIIKEIQKDSQNININNLENYFFSIPHIKNVIIHKDLSKNINVSISQYNPIARIVSGEYSGNYFDEDGHLFPISSKFSKRVILIHMNNEFELNELNNISSEFGKDFLMLIKYISSDEFFSKLISEIEIKPNKNIVIHPQFSKQKIIFGYPEDLNEKFEKVLLFYEKIIPSKGWNTYNTINVMYKNQIICDKS